MTCTGLLAICQQQWQNRNVAFRIEVCGGIASGKTTFAALFEHTGTVIDEDFQAVPFWQDFYAEPGKHAFETELSFLLQHFHQVKRELSRSQNVIVCDFSFWLDAAYARVSLNQGDLRAFLAVLEQVREHLGPPQLLISLDCPPITEMSRIRARGRAAERHIDVTFLENLQMALNAELRQVSHSVPVLNIESAKEDFAYDQKTRERWSQVVLSRVSELQKGAKG
jgi:deoxyadenosine/deoxycytidine kinase